MYSRLTRLAVATLAVAGFLTLAPRASADTVDHLNLKLTSSAGNGQNGGGPFGWSQVNTTSSPLNANFSTDFVTYCIDKNDVVRSGKFETHTDLSKAPTIGTNTNKLDSIVKLYDHFYSSSFANSDGTPNPTKQAAFQAALWKLIYGNGYTIDTSKAYGQQALKLLDDSAWNGVEHDLANAHLVALVSCDPLVAVGTSGRNQDQIIVVPNPKGVPAPPAVMLAGFGVLALFGRARWTRRTPAAAA